MSRVCRALHRRSGKTGGSLESGGAQKGEESPTAQAFRRRRRGSLNGLPDGRPAKPFAAWSLWSALSFLSGEGVRAKCRE